MNSRGGGRGARGGGRGRGMGGSGGGYGRGRGGMRGGRGGGAKAPPDGDMVLYWRYQDCINNVGPFLITPQQMSDLKQKILSSCRIPKDVIPICQERARFFYILTARDFPFAIRNSLKQAEWVRSGKGFNCGICDVFFDAHGELLKHNSLNCHKEIVLLFRNFDRVSREWYKKSVDPSYEVTTFTLDAERNGLRIDVTEEASTATITTPLNDKLFESLNVQNLDEEEFVLAAYDSIMEVHWPKPITTFYCRECNYNSFTTQELLEEHKKSEHHKNFMDSYSTSWCVSCQFNTGSRLNLEAHNRTGRHQMIVKILEDVRVKALDVWRRARVSINKAVHEKQRPLYQPLCQPRNQPQNQSQNLGGFPNPRQPRPPRPLMSTNYNTSYPGFGGYGASGTNFIRPGQKRPFASNYTADWSPMRNNMF